MDPDRLAEIFAQIDNSRAVLIAGPTASGKSAVALALAQAQGGVIVNADALQVHSAWHVLTARPTPAQAARAPHLLYGHVAPDCTYSVGDWLGEVAAVMATGVRPIIVGGTGLYLSALTEGLAEIPPVPAAVRAEATARLASGDLPGLVAQLDAATRDAIDRSNPARVRRAWEVWRATGRGLTSWQGDTGPPLLPRAAVTALRLDADPDWLGQRIDARFDAMLVDGAIEEARDALPHWDPAAPWAKAIGAAELIAHLRGEVTLPAAAAAVRTATRRYAKRQRTWLRARMRDWHSVTLP